MSFCGPPTVYLAGRKDLDCTIDDVLETREIVESAFGDCIAATGDTIMDRLRRGRQKRVRQSGCEPLGFGRETTTEIVARLREHIANEGLDEISDTRIAAHPGIPFFRVFWRLPQAEAEAMVGTVQKEARNLRNIAIRRSSRGSKGQVALERLSELGQLPP